MATFINTTSEEINIPKDLQGTINSLAENFTILYITKSNLIHCTFDYRDEKDKIIFSVSTN